MSATKNFTPLHQQVDEQARKYPSLLAAIANHTDKSQHPSDLAYHLTYQELFEKTNQLAYYLTTLGISPGSKVAIHIERSIDMVIAVLGILKAGACYVPIDSEYPLERKRFMLEDSGTEILLTHSGSEDILMESEVQKLYLDKDYWQSLTYPADWTAPPVGPLDLVYIIYTSGSTGKPKGVAMGHEALANLIEWQLQELNISVGDKTLQFTPLSFDVHFQEIFSTWSGAGTLVMVSEELRLNSVQLLKTIAQEKINRLFQPFTALSHLAQVAVEHQIFPDSLKAVITAGEQLQINHFLREFFLHLPNCRLFNHYGPSETHVVSSYPLAADPRNWEKFPAIGKAIANTQLYICDEQMQLLPDGSQGELYIAGKCLAQGYLNRPEITQQRFISNPFSSDEYPLLYKTGDLVRRNHKGFIEFLGRTDDQVKIRGYRIELGEVELAISNQASIQKAVVIASQSHAMEKQLQAYLCLKEQHSLNVSELRQALEEQIPDYMIPSTFMEISSIPMTPSGKVDRQALLAIKNKRPQLNHEYIAAKTPLEKNMVQLWSELLQIEPVGVLDSFFDLGGNSLLVLRFLSQLQKQQQIELSITHFFSLPHIKALAKYLEQQKDETRLAASAPTTQPQGADSKAQDIAIIGMAGRFPGANSTDELWRNLCAGVESISFFEPQQLHSSVQEIARNNPDYVLAKGVMPDADKFDSIFFGISPREAELMDPQQRVFLELCWSALENAAYMQDEHQESIGIYAGMGNNSYYQNNVLKNPQHIDSIGAFQVMIGNEKDYISTRVAHKLNLTGPGLSLHSGCSTSLVAVDLAVKGLRNGDCKMALAGGIAISSPQNSGYLFQSGGIYSPDGHCRPFDANAQGTLFNDGGGVVVLKPLATAIQDKDSIYAVIKGSAINNDGADKLSFTAPSITGQAAAIIRAQMDAGVKPEQIGYIEAHGTATPVGDPVEVEALNQAFQRCGPLKEKQFCYLGSIKSNIGHLTSAAGIAGLIKTALILKQQKIPATLHYHSANPQIDFANSPFKVNSQLLDWPSQDNRKRYAGVSSFGVGGTNAHVILEEPPQQDSQTSTKHYHPLLLAAKTQLALQQQQQQMLDFLINHPQCNRADMAYSLNQGRRQFKYRCAINVAELTAKDKPLPGKNVTIPKTDIATNVYPGQEREIVFMFPGQGAQYINMGSNLYHSEAYFRQQVDTCCDLLLEHMGEDLRTVLFPTADAQETAKKSLGQTRYTQPALFTIEYSLAKLWQYYGVNADYYIGHSIGELVAACLAGVFSLADALKLVAKRGKLMWELPPGSMLSVRSSAETVSTLLSEELSIAAINGPQLCVTAGPKLAIRKLQDQLDQQGIAHSLLHTSHAFHSKMMAPIVTPFEQIVRGIKLSAPKKPFVSTLTADWISDEQAQDPHYWAEHLRQPVQFAAGVKVLWQVPQRILLEVGPRTTATTLAKQQADNPRHQTVIASLSDNAEQQTEWHSLVKAMGQLWINGIAIDLRHYYQVEQRRRIPLPSYPFARTSYWLEIPQSPPQNDAQVDLPGAHSATINKPLNHKPHTIAKESRPMRKERLIQQLKELFEEASGIEFSHVDQDTTFFEVGLDSLFLTQVALQIKNQFKVEVTFRQLLEEFSNLDSLAQFLDDSLAPEPEPSISEPSLQTANSSDSQAQGQVMQQQHNQLANSASFNATNNTQLENLINQQLEVMKAQLAAISAQAPHITLANGVSAQSKSAQTQPDSTNTTPTCTTTISTNPVSQSPITNDEKLPKPSVDNVKKAFGAIARISLSGIEMNTIQQKCYQQFLAAYTEKTKTSKQLAQENRQHLADPRVVSGFKPAFKELVYPLQVNRSEQSHLFDLDNNQYVDLINGFGSSYFGYLPVFIKKAVQQQLEQGIEIGPQHPLAGEVGKLFCEMVDLERVTFCNTGSEAVLGAMRLARTVTGRKTIVMFSGSYHGIVDEVIARGTKKLKSIPSAPGIMPSAVQNILVLDYGTDETLKIIQEHAHELAAVLVEPVQSRRPDFQPKLFLEKLREITTRSGTALIFDEVITGFRIHPGGAQKHFAVKADIATYGKVIGGGMPIGVIAGCKRFMDALDGGQWQFGDDSTPQVGVTYFAGTFVRHPLALAAAKAALEYMREQGPSLQEQTNEKAQNMVNTMNQYCHAQQVPIKVVNFGSLFKIKFETEQPFAELLFVWMRYKGVHIWDGFPCFITIAHTQEDIHTIINAFKESIQEMLAGELLATEILNHSSATRTSTISEQFDMNTPPLPDARLGKDAEGYPAWFIANPEQPGKYIQLTIEQ